eukprot:TRINITY_DN17509_c0_g1_i5.p1 TRINITY_DN17509_c0_g1~~TRINITY_DN17509_c0_g1_i5.p1  ORF type:complete len:766 (-),score=122.42 TRINITY_DN17509_c0_g1_i5:38-2335(-)
MPVRRTVADKDVELLGRALTEGPRTLPSPQENVTFNHALGSTDDGRCALREKLNAFVMEHSIIFAESMMKFVDGEVSRILRECPTVQAEHKPPTGERASVFVPQKESSFEHRPDPEALPPGRIGKLKSMVAQIIPGSGDDKDEISWMHGQRALFANPDVMKEEVRMNISQKPYHVSDWYLDSGYCQMIARSNAFENLTLLVIALNSIWIAVESDLNTADIIWHADLPFIIIDNCFCAFFTFEVVVRFFSFQEKLECVKHFAFVFDTILVIVMVLETWVISTVSLLTTDGELMQTQDASFVKILRLARLTRTARMVRLLRSCPEVLILLNGLAVAMRSVWWTIVLLTVIIYIYALVFRQLAKIPSEGSDSFALLQQYFSSVPAAMGALVLGGIIPDSADIVRDCYGMNATCTFLIVTFILIASMALLNMLIAVICDMISVVSAVEKETLTLTYVKSKLLSMFDTCDADSIVIGKAAFNRLLLNPSTARCFVEVGVDVVGLVDFSDDLFRDGQTLSFADFMDLVLAMRGSNTACVKDIFDLRRVMSKTLEKVTAQTSFLSSQISDVRNLLMNTVVSDDTVRKGTAIPAFVRLPGVEEGIQLEWSASTALDSEKYSMSKQNLRCDHSSDDLCDTTKNPQIRRCPRRWGNPKVSEARIQDANNHSSVAVAEVADTSKVQDDLCWDPLKPARMSAHVLQIPTDLFKCIIGDSYESIDDDVNAEVGNDFIEAPSKAARDDHRAAPSSKRRSRSRRSTAISSNQCSLPSEPS